MHGPYPDVSEFGQCCMVLPKDRETISRSFHVFFRSRRPRYGKRRARLRSGVTVSPIVPVFERTRRNSHAGPRTKTEGATVYRPCPLEFSRPPRATRTPGTRIGSAHPRISRTPRIRVTCARCNIRTLHTGADPGVLPPSCERLNDRDEMRLPAPPNSPNRSSRLL